MMGRTKSKPKPLPVQDLTKNTGVFLNRSGVFPNDSRVSGIGLV
jgi:hypothetical protein